MTSTKFQIDILERKAKANGIPEETLQSLAALFSVNKVELREYISGINKSPLLCLEEEVEHVIELLSTIGISAEAQIAVEALEDLDLQPVDSLEDDLQVPEIISPAILFENDQESLETDDLSLSDINLEKESDTVSSRIEEEELISNEILFEADSLLEDCEEDEDLFPSDGAKMSEVPEDGLGIELKEQIEPPQKNVLSFDAEDEIETSQEIDVKTSILTEDPTTKDSVNSEISISFSDEDEPEEVDSFIPAGSSLDNQPTPDIELSEISDEPQTNKIDSPSPNFDTQNAPVEQDDSLSNQKIILSETEPDTIIEKPNRNLIPYISIFTILLITVGFYTIYGDEESMEVVISKNQIESILKENVSSEEQRISPKTFPIERYSGNLDFNDTILALKVKIQNKKIHSLTFEATKTKIEKISETEFLSKKFKPKFIALRSTAGSESSPKEMVESTARISYSIENKKKKAVSQLSFSFNPKDNKLVVFSKGANLNQNENYLEIGIPENDTHLSLKLSATIPLTPVVENNETTHSISDLIDSEIKKNSTASKISEKKKKRSKK